jgi:hypothetical protein
MQTHSPTAEEIISMGAYSKFKTDKKAEQEGIWLNYGDFRVKVARSGGANSTYRKELEKATQPYLRAIKTGTMDDSVAEKIHHDVFARTVVLDWNVNTAEKGEEPIWVAGIEHPDTEEVVPYTPEIGVEVFTIAMELFLDLREAAGNSSNFRTETDDVATGN